MMDDDDVSLLLFFMPNKYTSTILLRVSECRPNCSTNPAETKFSGRSISLRWAKFFRVDRCFFPFGLDDFRASYGTYISSLK